MLEDVHTARERELSAPGLDISSENYFSPPPFLVKWRKCNLRRKATGGRAEDTPSPHAEVTISRIPTAGSDWVSLTAQLSQLGSGAGKFGGPTYSLRILTVPNSFVVMVPSPSLSNRENASLNSAICSSVSWSAYKYILLRLSLVWWWGEGERGGVRFRCWC